MQDDLSRLVGRQGFEVKRVIEVGDQLDLEASWSRVAAVAPTVGAPRSTSRTAPWVRLHDLPLAGRVTHLV